MTELDDLARRAVAAVSAMARQGVALAGVVAAFVGVVAVGVYLIGLAALEDSARTGWLIVGGALVVIAVGAPLLARWRLSALRRNTTALVADVRTLLGREDRARRIVVETVESRAPDGTRTPAVIVQSQRFSGLRDVVGTAGDLRSLPAALRTIASFPVLLAVALLLVPVFLVLGLIFLIAWIL